MGITARPKLDSITTTKIQVTHLNNIIDSCKGVTIIPEFAKELLSK